MTLLDQALEKKTYGETLTFCLYRDIHKGIRSGLFRMTETIGQADGSDQMACHRVAQMVEAMVKELDDHAEHEDMGIAPALEIHLPEFNERVTNEHHALESRTERMVDLANCITIAPSENRRAMLHRLYLDSASFTSAYLMHQDMEERLLMPQLEDAVGLQELLGMHAGILASIPPDAMARSLALMLPAMNIDDRQELMEGMRMTAPPEAVEGVLALAQSVLQPHDFEALTRRLGM